MAYKPMTPAEVDEAIKAMYTDRIRSSMPSDNTIAESVLKANPFVGSNIEIDREALAASLEGANEYDGRYAMGFKCYEINTPQGTFPIFPTTDEKARLHGISQLNIGDIVYYKRPKADIRSRFQKFRDDWVHRCSHAWHALRGHDCD